MEDGHWRNMEKRSQIKDYRQPLDTGKSKETNSPLGPLKRKPSLKNP